MYLKQPRSRRNEGNTFEIAELPAKATCKLCRVAVGLPKTIRFDVSHDPHSPAYFGSKLPEPTQMLCGPDQEWCEVPSAKFGVIVTEVTRDTAGFIRKAVAQCPGYHMLIVQHNNEPRFGVLRTLKREFKEGKPYEPGFDIGSTAPRLLPTRYEILMKD